MFPVTICKSHFVKLQTFAGIILEKEKQNLSDKGKNYFRLMQQSAERMRQLIQDLLAFSAYQCCRTKI
jgi:signal transduction histidine kinase